MFDLAEMLKGVSNPDTMARERIEYLPIDDLVGDKSNFYALSGLNDLADNISTIGLQQPLRVRPCTGKNGEPKYRIVSGHRRYNALKLLRAEEPARGWDSVPCIVEDDDVSEAMQELRLIYANSGTRRMSAFEIERQAERVKDLLCQLRNEGMEFSGRMRDHVAQACQISATKLARLEAIRKHLSEDVYEEFWRTGRITETAAYELSQYEAELQEKTMNSLWTKACAEGKAIRFTEADIKAEAGRILKKQRDVSIPDTQEEEPEDVSIPDTIRSEPEDVSIPDTREAEPETVSDSDTFTAPPKWQTGEPPFEGPYLCKVTIGADPLPRSFRLDREAGEWMIPGAFDSIDESTTVTGWWPVPED